MTYFESKPGLNLNSTFKNKICSTRTEPVKIKFSDPEPERYFKRTHALIVGKENYDCLVSLTAACRVIFIKDGSMRWRLQGFVATRA